MFYLDIIETLQFTHVYVIQIIKKIIKKRQALHKYI